MKTYYQSYLVALLLSVGILGCAKKQQSVSSAYAQEMSALRMKKHQSFLGEESRFSLDFQQNFEGLDYFDISENYVLDVSWNISPTQDTVAMATSSGDMRQYRALGYMIFQLPGSPSKDSLKVFVPTGNPSQLFVPFRDGTSGTTSYGGGRYLDMTRGIELPVTVDFNQAYHPYCAYTEGFSCPIPPKENTIETAIEAGEKYVSDRWSH